MMYPLEPDLDRKEDFKQPPDGAEVLDIAKTAKELSTFLRDPANADLGALSIKYLADQFRELAVSVGAHQSIDGMLAAWLDRAESDLRDNGPDTRIGVFKDDIAAFVVHFKSAVRTEASKYIGGRVEESGEYRMDREIPPESDAVPTTKPPPPNWNSVTGGMPTAEQEAALTPVTAGPVAAPSRFPAEAVTAVVADEKLLERLEEDGVRELRDTVPIDAPDVKRKSRERVRAFVDENGKPMPEDPTDVTPTAAALAMAASIREKAKERHQVNPAKEAGGYAQVKPDPRVVRGSAALRAFVRNAQRK